MKTRPIVIIGGMGPQASHALHGQLLAKSRRHHNGDPNKYPDITHLSLRIPEFFGSSANEDKAVEIINQRLDSLRIPDNTIICMPCNTAHKLVKRLHLDNAQFVSMAEEVKERLSKLQENKIGLLASPNTLKSGFYDNILKQAGKSAVVPNSTDLEALEGVILSVIKQNDNTVARKQLSRLVKNLQDSGAEVILLGCTELSVIGVDTNLPILDSLDILGDTVIDRMLI